MIYVSGPPHQDLPLLTTPNRPSSVQPQEGQVWVADNGRFSAPQNYTDEKYLAWLAKMPAELCLFATAPDVVGDAAATLALSAPMFAPIRALGFPVAFVAQDGQEALPVPWDEIDALFIGGTTAWKLSTAAAEIAQEAKRRGKWVHMGRVNSLKRYRYAESIGCDSADGTQLRFRPDDHIEAIRHWVSHVNANPSLWGNWKENRDVARTNATTMPNVQVGTDNPARSREAPESMRPLPAVTRTRCASCGNWACAVHQGHIGEKCDCWPCDDCGELFPPYKLDDEYGLCQGCRDLIA